MRLGIFGGTFDPVHFGHLALAEECLAVAGLDEVWLVPAASPPHKGGKKLSRFDQRKEMLELAIAGNEKFKVEPMEADRPGPSFTIDTLEEIQKRKPNDELFLIIGGDSALEFSTWKDPAKIASLATIIVRIRPGVIMPTEQEFISQLGKELGVQPKVIFVAGPPYLDVSSSLLKERVSNNKSIRYLLPRAVEVYIQQKKLYLS
ncbi:MAG: nicotinate (nicotinamide) nucleotide adenylyltransferase [Planctomycetota bacterium]|jgi:nicotinate-nucleotide adenylyltransferase|nr:MAG: nicotinate (nicotinamide) nucleotide adenylyltransferase [Planctomycetota bacterium]